MNAHRPRRNGWFRSGPGCVRRVGDDLRQQGLVLGRPHYLLVRFADLVENLRAKNGDLRWGDDSQPNLTAADFENGDDHVVADGDRLTLTPREYEHQLTQASSVRCDSVGDGGLIIATNDRSGNP